MSDDSKVPVGPSPMPKQLMRRTTANNSSSERTSRIFLGLFLLAMGIFPTMVSTQAAGGASAGTGPNAFANQDDPIPAHVFNPRKAPTPAHIFNPQRPAADEDTSGLKNRIERTLKSPSPDQDDQGKGPLGIGAQPAEKSRLLMHGLRPDGPKLQELRSSIPSSQKLVINSLHDFSGIALTSGTWPERSVANNASDTSLCWGDKAIQLPTPTYTTSWSQRLCISQTYNFAEQHGREPAAIFLGDRVLRSWSAQSSNTWKWLAETAVLGPVANMACDMDGSSVSLQASELTQKFPVSPDWYVLGMGQYDCMEGSDPEDIVANVRRTVEVLRAVNCHSRVLVMGLLPTVVNDSSLSWGSSQYRRCIETANSGLQQMADARADADPGGVVFRDCGSTFLLPGGETLDSRLLPDGSELSSLGYAHLALCLSKAMTSNPVAKPSAYPEGFEFGERVSSPTDAALWPSEGDGAGDGQDSSNSLGAEWRFGEWSDCTARCGTGIQTRTADCVLAKDLMTGKAAGGAVLWQQNGTAASGDGLIVVPDSMCNEDRLQILRTCKAWDCEHAGWAASTWSSTCSKPCGGGELLREVVCLNSRGEEVEQEHCEEGGLPRPPDRRPCNTEPCASPCGDDTECSGHGSCEASSSYVFDEAAASGSAEESCMCEPGWHGPHCGVPEDCVSGLLGPSGQCCESGVVSPATGACCPHTLVLDSAGECCDPGSIDACGKCGGGGVGVDVFGTCCSGSLDAAGFCCDNGAVDECGVCRGRGSTCDLQGTVTVAAKSQGALERAVEDDLMEALASLLGPFGVSRSELSVEGLRLVAPHGHVADVSFLAKAAPLAGRLGWPQVSRIQQQLSKFQQVAYPNLTDLHSLSRHGSCGNGICELGEQATHGRPDADDCPQDCGIVLAPCPAGKGPFGAAGPEETCSGRGRCSSVSGACDCWLGYGGEDCSLCDGGYTRHPGTGTCVPTSAQLTWIEEDIGFSSPPGLSWAKEQPSNERLAAKISVFVLSLLLLVAIMTLLYVHMTAHKAHKDITEMKKRSATFHTSKLFHTPHAAVDEEFVDVENCCASEDTKSSGSQTNLLPPGSPATSEGEPRSPDDSVDSLEILSKAEGILAGLNISGGSELGDVGASDPQPSGGSSTRSWISEPPAPFGLFRSPNSALNAGKAPLTPSVSAAPAPEAAARNQASRRPPVSPVRASKDADVAASAQGQSTTAAAVGTHRGHQRGQHPQGFGSWDVPVGSPAIGFGSWDMGDAPISLSPGTSPNGSPHNRAAAADVDAGADDDSGEIMSAHLAKAIGDGLGIIEEDSELPSDGTHGCDFPARSNPYNWVETRKSQGCQTRPPRSLNTSLDGGGRGNAEHHDTNTTL